MLKAGRHPLPELNMSREPFRVVKNHGDGVTTITYYGQDGLDQWRDAVREQQVRASMPAHVVAWAKTEPGVLA